MGLFWRNKAWEETKSMFVRETLTIYTISLICVCALWWHGNVLADSPCCLNNHPLQHNFHLFAFESLLLSGCLPKKNGYFCIAVSIWSSFSTKRLYTKQCVFVPWLAYAAMPIKELATTLRWCHVTFLSNDNPPPSEHMGWRGGLHVQVNNSR